MKSLFLNKNKFKRLILFFNGWSLDENIVNHLTAENYDVLMFYVYSNLEIPEEIIEEVNSYEEANIIAWSFGVWACGDVIKKFKNLKNFIAINGTLVPIDKNFGIPQKIFDLTLSNLSEKNYPRFFKNMFLGEADLDKLPQRNIENQRQELIQIQKSAFTPRPLRERVEFQNEGRVLEIRGRGKLFNKVFIGMHDKIIPAQNQINFWTQKEDLKIIKTDGGHYLFDLFKTWDEIINVE